MVFDIVFLLDRFDICTHSLEKKSYNSRKIYNRFYFRIGFLFVFLCVVIVQSEFLLMCNYIKI